MKRKTYKEIFNELRETGLGKAWDKIDCVCDALLRDRCGLCNHKNKGDYLI